MRSNWTFTILNLSALVLGLILAVLVKNFHIRIISDNIGYLEFIGRAWILSLLAIAVPLAATYIISSIMSLTHSRIAGRLGISAIKVLLIYTITGVVLSLAFVYTSLHFFGPKIPKVYNYKETVEKIVTSGSDANPLWLTKGIVFCSNLQGQIGNIFLILLVISLIFALFTALLPEAIRLKLLDVFRNLATRILQFLQKYLLTMPAGIFCLVLSMILKVGLQSVVYLIYFVPLFCVVLILGILIFYPAVYAFGSVTLRKFSTAMIPSQVFAISSRSSLATLPSLIECAESKLKLPSQVSGLIIPFFISSFKMNYCITGAFQLIFFAFVFDVDLDALTIAVFIVSHLFISLVNPGIPGGAAFSSLPFYLAAGIPAEAYILSQAVEDVPDMFKTVLNVTGVMMVATVITKKFSLQAK